ncbi:MAG: transcriptional repressor [Methylocystaceae bacterium]|nr:transcriptional repressor [Methylocystaceae bacterium]
MKPIGIEDAPALLVSKTLSASGLRPTRQRLALAALLFNGSDRHVTAERLFDEAIAARLSVSLATVYNTLHQFTAAGLLREIAVDGAKVYFDTNVSEHHHFLNEETGELLDIEDGLMQVGKLPPSPKGLRVARVDIVIRLRPDQP